MEETILNKFLSLLLNILCKSDPSNDLYWKNVKLKTNHSLNFMTCGAYPFTFFPVAFSDIFKKSVFSGIVEYLAETMSFEDSYMESLWNFFAG